MTVPGLGGQQPPPQNASPAGQLTPGVTPGVTGQIVATRVIIVGANGELLVYNPSVANGNLAVSISGAGGTGLASDTVQAGVTVYASGGFPFTQLESGVINAKATSSQFAPAIIQTAGVAGEIAISSGLATNTDNPANIVVDSAQASGISTPLVSVQANLQVTGDLTVVTINGSANTGDPVTDATIATTSGNFNGGTLTSHNHSFGHTHPI